MLEYELADTLAELGRRQGANRARAIELLVESSALLGKAKRMLRNADLEEPQRRSEQLRMEAASTRNACLVAELLPDDDEARKEAHRLALALTVVAPSEEESNRVQYNVACALAVAARVLALPQHGAGSESFLERAKIWLLHAAAGNERWWMVAHADPDLVVRR